MPIPPRQPGVHVEEVPAGPRPIAGVATAITAFVGRAASGPVETPVTCTGWGDFDRVFGGLFAPSALGHAVRDFFLNGGREAVILRLHRSLPGQPDSARLVVRDPADEGALSLTASSPGRWGNALRARIDHDASEAEATALGLPAEALFSLSVRDGATGAVELFRNLTTAEHARRIDRVLAAESRLVRLDGALPAGRPAAHAPPAAGRTVWEDAAASSGVAPGAAAGDGAALQAQDFIGPGFEAAQRGLYALDRADPVNLLCIPPHVGDDPPEEVEPALLAAAVAYAERRRAFLLLDSPANWTTPAQAAAGPAALGVTSANAALFFPRLLQPDPLRGGLPRAMPACGAIAGLFARTDAERGVWKAAAGTAATLRGATGPALPLGDAAIGQLSPPGVNCLRALPGVGVVVWGSRTCQGDDRQGSAWKYIPVRRLALFLEESLVRGLAWAALEPNDEALWARLRQATGEFLQGLFRQGAFQGSTAREAYLVQCDAGTTGPADIDAGLVNILVGFAPLRPAEFVMLRLRQSAGRPPG
ncbi:phage tail sheath subtilisin-like domain-containing protein [Siccirubricoccus sp. KC 17139]|uniref:Phage tail sheath subtilisin-like domain-containing protein n=1 Tax=Siccirubricoccus soli TaxID=2899147 RepID=A0ABT1D8T9_9PROT|nr:phage tail sheath subtilisin-like domain-containing protein [Siccirubricoccus soli]MCO6418321.1 phage tail sheath subtilisin-like domain-containing protein [Siccirubricoccus soli]MCP2684456.1 phage tail sheath subtilisin-like domain-containing protein [Siccirubricoccus soli]